MLCVALVVLATLLCWSEAHTVCICYDVKSTPGVLKIYQEHWHGDLKYIPPYGILFSDPSTPIDFSKWKLIPHALRNNVNRAQLKKEIGPNLVCNECYPEKTYNDW